MSKYEPTLGKAYSQYGASMGRGAYGQEEEIEGRVYATRIRLDSGGYDKGGAYWGSGAPLYHVYDQGGRFERFVRASSSKAAKEQVLRGRAPEHARTR